MNIIKNALLITLLALSLHSSELKNISLQLQWKYQFQFAGYIIAKEKGFYKDIGLDVNIKEWQYGINMVDEIISKKSQYAILRPTSMIDISKGKEIVYLTTIYQSSPLMLLADKSSGITSVKDFKNKRIMTTGDLNTDTSIVSMMFSQGVKLEELEVLNPSFNVKDLIDKKTDLMASYISNEPFRLKELGGDPVIFSPKDYGFDFYNDIVSTSKKYLHENQDEVKKFTEATLKGWKYAFSNIEETANIIYNKYNTQNKTIEALKYEGKELKKLAYFQTNKLGKIEKKKLEKIYDVYKLLGYVKTNIDFNKIVYNELFLSKQLSNEEEAYLENKKYLTVMSLKNFQPFNFRKNDEPMGYSIDIMKLIGDSLNKEIRFVTKPWNEQLQMLENGKLDIIPHLAITEERKEFAQYTDFMHLTFLIGFAINKDQKISSMKDLEGKTLALVKGYYLEEHIKNNFPKIKILALKSTEDTISAVAEGKAFAVVDNIPTLNYYIQEKWLSNLKISNVKDFGVPLQTKIPMGVKKGNDLLKSILEKTNASLPQDEVNKIKSTWVNKINLEANEYKLTKKEQEFIQKNPVIRFRVRSHLPPFELVENGRVEGLAVDYIKLISKQMGFEAKFVINNDPLDIAFEEVEFKREKYDTVLFTVKNDERSKRFSFGNTYLSYPMMIFTHKKSNIINNMYDLKDKKIVVEKGYLTKKWIQRDFPGIKIITAENSLSALKMLNNMEADVYIGNLAQVNFSKSNYGLKNIQIAAPSPYKDVKFSFIAPKQWPELTSILSKGYNKIPLEKHKSIQQKWFSYHTIEKINYDLVWKILLVSTVIIFWIIWWNRKLRLAKEKITLANKELDKANKKINTYLNIVDKNVITSSTDLKGNIISVSEAFCKISGYTKEELIGQNHRIIRHPDMQNEMYEKIWRTLNESEIWEGEIKNQRRDGTFYWVKATISPLFNENNIKIGYTAIRQDITDKKVIEEISITDGLTEIYNRRHFNQIFPKIINSGKRHNKLVSLIVMDIDFFKQYNDSFGHQMGDEALIKIAKTINNSLKRADDYCFRLGGEEFGVIFEVDSKEKAIEFANQIRTNIEKIQIRHSNDCKSKYITASLGLISKKAKDISNSNDIFKEADDLLYKAKASGRNIVISN